MTNVQTLKGEVRLLKGFRDLSPEEAAKKDYVLGALKSVFSSFGFVPLETPTLEYAEVLEGKYGAEEKLIYKFKDKGGREVAMRYDQTVPLARYIAQNPPEAGKLVFPFKRYQIQNVFRAEKPQAGRYREFTQVDIDTVGIDSALADAEIIAAIDSALDVLGLKKFEILLNDRALFSDLDPKAVRILDKWEKLGLEGVKKGLTATGFDPAKILKRAKEQRPTPRLKEVFDYLSDLGIERQNYRFDPLLARGLDYYTGVIFELKVEGFPGSIGGGGRYNNLIGMFTKEKLARRSPERSRRGEGGIPAVGFSFGLDRLMEVLDDQKLLSDVKPDQSKILVTIFSPALEEESIKLLTELQALSIPAEIYLDPTARLDKQLKYADKKGIPYAAILGPQEKSQGKITLKDLAKKTQKILSLEEIRPVLGN